MKDLISETDIREKIIAPWLNAVGITPDKVKMEHSFNIRLGHGIYEINSQKQRNHTSGRADYLIKGIDDINLFVLEAKKFGADLTEEDRNQVISYARLVEEGNIPPFAILTNGTQTLIYDVLTKCELDLADFANHTNIKSGFIIKCGIDLKTEALHYLISLSSENLQAFCQGQVSYRMQPLRSDDIYSGKKYIPQLYCRRTVTETRLSEILFDNKTEKPVVVVTGPPQHGKTSFLCHTAERLLFEGYPCLFYPAIGLKNGLLNAIQEDFGWVFKNDLSPIQVVKQFQMIVSKKETNLILIIDGLNEIDREKALLISEECSRLKISEIKIIVSATNNSLSRILFEADNPTYISDASNITRGDVDVLKFKELQHIEQKNIIQLGNFTKEELSEAIGIYSSAYSVKTNIIDKLLSNPFYMGRAMELYSGKELPKNVNTKELISEGIIRKGRRANKEPLEIKKELSTIASLLFKKGAPVVDFTEIDINPTAIIKLCDIALIAEVHNDIGTYGIDFYYSRERDYYIAFELRRWNIVLLDIEKVETEMVLAQQTNTGKEALRWFLSCSFSLSHLKFVYELLQNKKEYNDLFSYSILNQEFESIDDIKWLNLALDKLTNSINGENELEEKSVLMFKILEASQITPNFITANQLHLVKELLKLEVQIEDIDLQESFSSQLRYDGFQEIYLAFLLENDSELVEATALLLVSDYSDTLQDFMNDSIRKKEKKFLQNKEFYKGAIEFCSHRASDSDSMCGSVLSYDRDVEELLGILDDYKNSYGEIIKFYEGSVGTHFLNMILDIQDQIKKQCNGDESLLNDYIDYIGDFEEYYNLENPSQNNPLQTSLDI